MVIVNRLVWVVDPAAERLTVYGSLLSPRVLAGHDTLDGGDVLPAFRARVAEIFEI